MARTPEDVDEPRAQLLGGGLVEEVIAVAEVDHGHLQAQRLRQRVHLLLVLRRHDGRGGWCAGGGGGER